MKKNHKKNPLNPWVPRYRFPIFLQHPIDAIRSRLRDIKNFLHRGQYGYCCADAWNWYTWWTTAGAEALRYMANHGCAYPKAEPWDTPDKWRAYLLDLADRLQWSSDSINYFPYDETRNEYYTQMEEIRKKKYRNNLPLTDEEERIKELYWNRVDELRVEDIKKREELFTEIGRNLGFLWD